jgi:hypothetical protein
MASDSFILGVLTFSVSLVAALSSLGVAPADMRRARENEQEVGMTTQRYAGLWVTADGQIRHELLPDGRYVEARGERERAYAGRYAMTGDHIDYLDDKGFTADGDFKDGILYHAGMVLYRRDSV